MASGVNPLLSRRGGDGESKRSSVLYTKEVTMKGDWSELLRVVRPYLPSSVYTRVVNMVDKRESSHDAGVAAGFPGGVPDTHHQAALAAAHDHVQPGPGYPGI